MEKVTRVHGSKYSIAAHIAGWVTFFIAPLLLSPNGFDFIDFGTGVSFKRDTVTITRIGKIIITRNGDTSSRTEVTTFENYSVNRVKIEGIKTRISTFDAITASASSTTTVANGKFTFADGTDATWTSEKSRTSDITIDESTGKPVSGEIATDVDTSIATAAGLVIYSHVTTQPLLENVACAARRKAPVSGIVETNYRDNKVSLNFGDGTCENKTVTITINGTTTTKTIGG